MAIPRTHSRPSTDYSRRSHNSQFANALAGTAESVARSMGTTGWCYRGVARALSRHGVNVSGGSAYMAADQLARNSNFTEIPQETVQRMLATGQVPRGAVLVHGRSGSKPHGHIAVSLGNGQEASDHVQSLIRGNGYGGTRIFMPTDAGQNRDTMLAGLDRDARNGNVIPFPSNQGGFSPGGSSRRGSGQGLPSFQTAAYSPGYRQAHGFNRGGNVSPFNFGNNGFRPGGESLEELIQRLAAEYNIPVEELRALAEDAKNESVSPAELRSKVEQLAQQHGAPKEEVQGVVNQAQSPVRPGQNRVNPGQLVQLARQAGFSEDQAITMAAIAMAESGGNSRAHNGNAGTGDNSFGLWQINMLGGMGPERRRAFGISSNDQLFDPQTNARAARNIFQSQGFNAWSVYRSGAYRQYLSAARQGAASTRYA